MNTIAWFIILILAGCPEVSAETLQHKTLQRKEDAIIIAGSELKTLTGARIDSLRVFSSRENKFSPIPYQIDERDAKGNLVLPEGERLNRDDPPGTLDKNDELVFMAKDLGDRIRLDNNDNIKDALELELTDPLTGQQGWAYLLRFGNPPAPSPVDYIDYSAEANRVDSSYYTIGFIPGQLTIDYEAIHGCRGGSNQDIIDRLKLRIKAKLRRHLSGLSFGRTEDDFRLKILSYKDGAIRIIVKGKPKVYLVFGWYLPFESMNEYYYLNHRESLQIINIPVKLSKIFSQFRFQGLMDHNHLARGMTFYNSKNLQGFKIDGKTSEGERNMDLSEYEWMALTGPQGTELNLFERVPGLEKLKRRLIYQDDAELNDPPESEPGTFPTAGYEVDFTEADKGILSFHIRTYFLPSFKPGDEIEYLNIYKHPLELKTKETER